MSNQHHYYYYQTNQQYNQRLNFNSTLRDNDEKKDDSPFGKNISEYDTKKYELNHDGYRYNPSKCSGIFSNCGGKGYIDIESKGRYQFYGKPCKHCNRKEYKIYKENGSEKILKTNLRLYYLHKKMQADMEQEKQRQIKEAELDRQDPSRILRRIEQEMISQNYNLREQTYEMEKLRKLKELSYDNSNYYNYYN